MGSGGEGAYELDGDGGGEGWGSRYGVTVSRQKSGLALLAGRDLTLTASQPELSDEV